MPFYLNNACLTLVFSSCLHLSDFLTPDKETIIGEEKALKPQILKGIRVNKKCCLISRRNSISTQTQNTFKCKPGNRIVTGVALSIGVNYSAGPKTPGLICYYNISVLYFLLYSCTSFWLYLSCFLAIFSIFLHSFSFFATFFMMIAWRLFHTSFLPSNSII